MLTGQVSAAKTVMTGRLPNKNIAAGY